MKKLSITIGISVAMVAAVAALGSAKDKKSADQAAARGLNTFGAVVKEVETNYVDTIDNERAFQQAINALLNTIDPYTVYYPQENTEDITKMTTGEYGGIGSYLMTRKGSSYISEPMLDAPSQRAGLKAGDKIVKVDTIDVSKTATDEVSKLLRGKPDTQVTIQVIRPYDTDSLKTFTLTRAKLREKSVPFAGIVNGNTGYIRLTQFIEKSGEEVRKALEEFKNHPELTGIVLDLRGNGGGLLEQAVDIASNFLPKGTEVVRTRGRNPKEERIYKTIRTPLYPDIPLAVLIDGGTASASEILAGAIQDLDRGILVGSRSFGKGLVQTTRPLPYGGVLKVTVARYYTPSGRLIQSLDYSHRNEDGSAARVPDSLTHAYSTKAGRIIRDGGGLKPDSTITWPKVNTLVYNIVRDNWVFDYATKYAAEHPSIPAANVFTITDSIYSDFKASIDPEKFRYDDTMDKATEQLRDIAKDEGLINDETTAAFDHLKALLKHDLQRDLDKNRKQVAEYLGSEIIGRYYYEPGRTEYLTRGDDAIDTAISIINSPEYKQLLSAPTAATKNK